jgi:hypothetical protein
MIVQPDFLEHWKTLHLVELTGDESAPLAVIRFWAHCQNQKRGVFPGMTPPQLATICRWGNRKPACHVALVKSGFVEKLKPKGFAAHEWEDHNRQLLQKWEAGKKGGRPAKNDSTNEINDSEKPTGNRSLTDLETVRNSIDKIRPDQIDQTREDENRTEPIDQTDAIESGGGSPFSPSGNGSFGSVLDLAKSVSTHRKGETNRRYSKEEIGVYLSKMKPALAEFAPNCFKTLEKQGWCTKSGEPIEHPLQWCSEYAEGCLRNKATTQSSRIDRNAGTANADVVGDYAGL